MRKSPARHLSAGITIDGPKKGRGRLGNKRPSCELARLQLKGSSGWAILWQVQSASRGADAPSRRQRMRIPFANIRGATGLSSAASGVSFHRLVWPRFLGPPIIKKLDGKRNKRGKKEIRQPILLDCAGWLDTSTIIIEQ